jgi:serine/threonine protein kinase/tetratricopeptide (TPR) repeat protein
MELSVCGTAVAEQGNREKEIFEGALDCAPGEERQRYLESACGGDTVLLARIQALLRADDAGEDFLPEEPAGRAGRGSAVAGFLSAPLTEQPGDIICRYKLREKIGEGGCGVVYMAEQEEPVRRKVALKIIKLGMDTRQVVARFEAERQALALMDHVNIAKVLDAGGTETGRPYFVMELVGGIKITDYCEQQQLTTPQRLNLFTQVCRAIQHAHQKGVIHRDIKPSNVLVAIQDGVPIPKVIDFGIAKATQGRLTDDTVFTAFEQFLGTPAYMSPEQAQLGGQDVDTRSDIYSLGVLLYELLTGKTPFDAKELMAVGLEAMRRTICEKDPPTPSTRLKLDLATQRAQGSGESKIKNQKSKIANDLDWIVMKCLEKDRARRYETANGLAMDIERHLANEPVVASPPSRLYRFQKLVRRNRATATATTIVAATLILGAVVSAWQAWRATKAREAEIRQRNLAEESERKAIVQKQIAEAVTKFLQQDLLGQADPWQRKMAGQHSGGGSAAPKNPTVKDLLNRAAIELEPDKIDAKFPGQQEVQAAILMTIGEAYYGTGDYGKAEEFATRASELYRGAIGEDNVSTVNSLYLLARAYREAGRVTQALELLERMRDGQVKRLGAESPQTLRTISELAQTQLDAHDNLHPGIDLLEQVHNAQIRKLGAGHPDTLATATRLADIYATSGKPTQAIDILQKAREASAERLGVNHPSTLRTMAELAWAYHNAGKLQQAFDLLEKASAIQEEALGPDHPETLETLQHLGDAYLEANKPLQAIDVLKRVRDARNKRLGRDHPDTLYTLCELGFAYSHAGNLPAAIELLEQVMDIQVKKFGPDNEDTLGTMNALAGTYQSAGKLQQAIALFEQCRDATQRKLGANHPNSIVAQFMLARAYLQARLVWQALPLFRQAAEGMERQQFQSLNVQPMIQELVNCLDQCQLYDEALDWYRKWLAVVKQSDGPESQAYAKELEDLGSQLMRRRQWPQAAATLGECLALRERLWPDDPVTFHTKKLLGEALLGHEKYAEAESVLLAAYDGLRLHEPTNPTMVRPWLKEIIQTLLNIGEITDRADKADAWRSELTKWYRGEVERYRRAAENGDPQELNGAAWLLATCEDAAVRDGPLAVTYAAKAVAATSRKDPGILDTLAAAYAEVGDFAKALRVQKEAQALAQNESVKEEFALRIKSYESNTPHRELPDDWATLSAKRLRGEMLLAQQKSSAAEPALISAYEALKQREVENPSRVRPWLKDSIRSLLRLYEIAKRPEKVARWKAELTQWYCMEIEDYRKTAQSDDLQALNGLAWRLATCEDALVRDGPEAVIYAEKAVAATGRRDPRVLDTLGAAYAETGDFAKAISVQKEALALAQGDSTKRDFASRLKLFESNTPYREP